ncbi:hypothetical protein DJ531_04970, partial [Sulfolobus sp. A20-N-F6]
MIKNIIDKYVITSDSDNIHELKELVDLLEKYNVKAYNYKVEYLRGKVNIRVMKGNVILDLANLTLGELEETLNKSEELFTNRFKITFHNCPSLREILDKLERTNLPYSEINVFRDSVKIRIIDKNISFIDSRDLEATYYLSLILDKVNLTDVNLGRITRVNDMLAFILLKAHGIRDLNLLREILAKDYIIRGDEIVI